VCPLLVSDNGCGMQETEAANGGLGLGNLRRRAEKLNGQFFIESGEAGGTLLTWQVPISE
jgi:signal transduction histidine kinase